MKLSKRLRRQLEDLENRMSVLQYAAEEIYLSMTEKQRESEIGHLVLDLFSDIGPQTQLSQILRPGDPDARSRGTIISMQQ